MSDDGFTEDQADFNAAHKLKTSVAARISVGLSAMAPNDFRTLGRQMAEALALAENEVTLFGSGSREDNEREERDSKIDRKAAIAATKAKRNNG